MKHTRCPQSPTGSHHRLLESDDMHYQRAGVRALFCILAMTAESLAHLSADVTDLQRRIMDRMRGMPDGEEE